MSSDASARALLHEMQARLATGPHAALNVPMHATASDIRGAFLQLTKRFHPARFGRMSMEIQRLSNEVFLALRAAHDQLAKPMPMPNKPSGRAKSTTAIPANKGQTKPFGVSGSPPLAPPSTGPVKDPPTQPPNRGGQPIAPFKTPMAPAPAPTQSPPSSAKPPAPTLGPPNQHGTTIRFPTMARSSGPTPGTTPPAPPIARPTSTSAQPPPTSRAANSSSQNATLDRELAPILELMGMGMWDAAQAAVDSLVSRNPQNKRYGALGCYARGRRAQLEGRIRDAQIELQEALTLDPDLDVAKTAVAELYARRK